MDQTENLAKAIEFLKSIDPQLSNSDIGKRLGYRTENYLTEIIAGNKKINRVFLEKLKDEFFINPDFIKHGVGPMSFAEASYPHKHDKDNKGFQKKYVDLVESRMEEIEEDKKFLQRLMESNLSLLADGQRMIQAQISTIHQWDAIKDAESKAKDLTELDALIEKATEKIHRLLVKNLDQANKGGSTAVSQSSQEEGKSQPPLRGQMANLLGKGGMGSTVKNRSKKNSVSEKDK